MKSLMCLRLLRSEALVADFSTLRAFLHHIMFRLEDLLATQLRHFEFHEVDLHEGHLHEVASSGSSKRRFRPFLSGDPQRSFSRTTDITERAAIQDS